MGGGGGGGEEGGDMSEVEEGGEGWGRRHEWRREGRDWGEVGEEGQWVKDLFCQESQLGHVGTNKIVGVHC